MRFELKLEPAVWHAAPLEFTWDSDTGELGGRDAEAAAAFIAERAGAGWVPLKPGPASYGITDPLHKPDEMAAICGTFWRLPPELLAHYPHPEQPEDDTVYAIDEHGNATPVGKIVY